MSFASLKDIKDIEEESSYEDRKPPVTIHGFLGNTARDHGSRPAVSFQILSGPRAKAETLTWSGVFGKAVQTANLFRALGVGEKDVVAYLLPNSNETVLTLLGGMIAGISSPINPLLEAEQIADIMRGTGAKILVTLKGFPKTDISEKAHEAVAMAPSVKTVLEVDLNRYLSPPKSWIVPMIRPKPKIAHKARVLDFVSEVAKQPKELTFADGEADRVAAFFHTGGTTGRPKVAQHKCSGMIYNGWLGHRLLFDENDVLICPLPLFHVFACHPVLMSVIASGAHVVFPTPAGYRGDGVFDNFWKLIRRWRVTFAIGVPTALSALMQRPVNADVSSLKTVFSGSAPLPVDLYKRFEKATDVTIVEGYGLTEATCLVSCNPPAGGKKIGSVGLPFPYTDVRIVEGKGGEARECRPGEAGEICVSSPGVIPGGTYTEEERNRDLYHQDRYLRTGDLGYVDEDGYLFITGRAKDLIIRGGHNIDPAVIEDALASHEGVAFAGAVEQPDAHSGELPCAYVELTDKAKVTVDELMEHCRERIHERAAHPKHLEILDELPKTAVGKVFKPDLRRRAITRVYDAALAKKGIQAKVAAVVEDKRRGLVAIVEKTGEVDGEAVAKVLGAYARPWEWAD